MIFEPMIPVFIIYITAALLAAFTIFCIIKKSFRKAKVFRRIAIIALFLVVLMRPAVSGGTAERDLSNLNIFFVVDNTGSMAAKDMNNSSKYRYEVAREDMKKIVKLFPGSKFAAIVLDYNVFQAMPLIDNTDTVYSFINVLSPKTSTSSADTNLSKLLDAAADRIAKYNKRFPDRDSIFILFSDGEDIKQTTEVPKKLSENIASGAIIGYGTTTGTHVGTINYKQEISEVDFITDNSSGLEHISKLDEDNLRNIAKKLNLPYYRRSSSDDKFNNKDNFAKKDAIYHHSEDKANVNREFYWIFALLILALLLWDFSAIISTLLLERKAVK